MPFLLVNLNNLTQPLESGLACDETSAAGHLIVLPYLEASIVVRLLCLEAPFRDVNRKVDNVDICSIT